ncbi:MAG: late competence development ComFB family protein [Bacteroidales bacterium]|nr:late competence development ComFB family protein [Clostridium sp.]MCM1204786.1 late competence development ComFB family protein [Bacteroidales bacterium]
MRKIRMLLVTEDSSVRKTVTDLLKEDYECIPIQNEGKMLSHELENIGWMDLMVIDLQIRGMDAFELLQKIGDDSVHKSVPVLALASPEQAEGIAEAFEAGVDDVIFKPLSPNVLKKRADNMVYIGRNRRVHNVMEDLIWEGIDESIDTLGVCSCPVCRRDLLTMTLNKVPPKYVTTEKGKTIAKAQSQASSEEKIKLLTELAYCAQMVKQNPRHG